MNKKILILVLVALGGIAFAESYKFLPSGNGVQRLSDGAFIPFSLGNKDYSDYQAWVSSGNVTQAADPPPTPAQILADLRLSALAYLDSTQGPSKAERAFILVLIDELNILRQRDRDRASDVAAATSLADLKTRWAVRSSLADRDVTQVKPAIQNKINSGAAD